MSAIDDFCITIRQWMNWGDEEYPDSLITTMLRMGEERLNEDLRIADQVQVSEGTVVTDRFTLPSDWLESDFVRVVGGGPLDYKSRHDFYTKGDTGDYENAGKFTTIGRYIIVDGSLDGETVELSYFGQVPPLGIDPTWVYTKFSGLLISATLVAASAYYVEDDRLGIWTSNVTETINRLNAAYKMAQPSGSRLNTKTKRTFG